VYICRNIESILSYIIYVGYDSKTLLMLYFETHLQTKTRCINQQISRSLDHKVLDVAVGAVRNESSKRESYPFHFRIRVAIT